MKNILIVEDSKLHAEMLRDFLLKHGYNIAGIAGTGEEALEKALSLKPDLIFMDITIKGELDGIEAAREIKKHLDIPVVFVTSHSSESYLERALQVSPFGYVLKPINEDQLRVTLETVRCRIDLMNELTAKNEELENFAYTVSHDIKGPLTTIVSYMLIIKKKYSGVVGGEGMEYFELLMDKALKMSEMINILLDYSRLGPVVEEFEEMVLEEVVSDAMQTMEPTLFARKTQIIIRNGDRTIKGDRIKLIEVFSNLISNAEKYMSLDNPSPRIEIGAEKLNNETAYYVKDNGIGIKKEHFQRVFQLFQRLEVLAEAQGAGAGLAIVKRIVEAHKGRVWVESEPDKGSTFYFTILTENI